jgi:hypothetical protein
VNDKQVIVRQFEGNDLERNAVLIRAEEENEILKIGIWPRDVQRARAGLDDVPDPIL